MNVLIPESISSPKPYLLMLSWRDGFSATITLQAFRDECPCAVCRGESIMGTTYALPGMKMFKPGMYELDGINSVGNYAIQAAWKDGHNTGIYSWNMLREIAEKHQLTNEQLAELEKKEFLSSN
jgi:DUF971 family protein